MPREDIALEDALRQFSLVIGAAILRSSGFSLQQAIDEVRAMDLSLLGRFYLHQPQGTDDAQPF